MATSTKKSSKKIGGKKSVKRATSTKKRRYNRGPRVARADIPETQQKIIAHLGRDVAGPPVTLRDIGNLLGFSGSPSNVYQRVLRIIGPMRGERLDWGRGRGKGIYLLHSRKNGSNGNGARTQKMFLQANGNLVLPNDPRQGALHLLLTERSEAEKHVARLNQAIAALEG